MPEIAAFKGIRYNPERVNLRDVITRIEHLSTGLHKHYHRSKHDLLCLMLGCEDEESRRRARAIYRRWLKDGILVQDQPSIYVYYQQFDYEGTTFIRKGFIAATLVQPYGPGNLMPHEHIFPQGKEYHLRLMHTLQKNFEQVFAIYEDEANTVCPYLEPFTEGEPLAEITDEFDTTHRLWRIDDRAVQREVADFMRGITGVIADGHHRYEASLAYRKEMSQKYNGPMDRAFNYRLIYFVRASDPGLVILPTHRLLRPLSENQLKTALDRASQYFDITRISDGRELLAAVRNHMDTHAFGLYSRSGKYLLVLKDERVMDEIAQPGWSRDYRRLDVTILHTLLIQQVFDFRGVIGYQRYPERVFENVDTGKFDLGVLMNPTKPQEVIKVAMNGEKMPQKSTDFYPKLVTGLVSMDISPFERVVRL